MTDVALSILALIAGGLTLELFGVAVPPVPEHQSAIGPVGIEALETAEDSPAGNPS